MRHHRFTTTTITLLLFLLPKSWSFSPRPRVSALKSAVTDEVKVATDNGVATDSNVLVFSPLYKKSSDWKSLIPLIPGERGCDVSIEWSVPQEGSRRLLQHLFSSPVVVDKLQPFLQESFETFQSLATTSNHRKFKARIVATRGPSGTKCPRWHVDHVPLRWIQSLVGPGCDYVLGCEGIDWEAMNDLNSVEKDANEKLVNEDVADIHHAPTQQGVVLLGAENTPKGLTPAVHKSPSMGVFEGRLLLTLDVVRDE
jgi:hypothetical protein